MKISTFRRLLRNNLLLSALLALGATAVHAQQNVNWTDGTASYTNASDWSIGIVPTGSGYNVINDQGTNAVLEINGTDPSWSVWDIRAANGNNAGGAYLQNGSTVSVGGWFRLGIGTGSTGIYTLNSGTLNVNLNRLNVGELGTGILNVNGGTINFNNGAQFALGDGPTGSSGTVNQTAGTINSAGELWVANNQGVSTYNLSGGNLNVHNWVAIGREQNGNSASGVINMTGGTFTKDGNGNFLVGTGNNSTGVLNQSGGSIVSQSQFLVPESGNSSTSGTYNLTNGTLLVNNWIAIGRNGGTGILNLYGGTITKTGGTSDHFDVGAGAPGTINQTGGLITNTTSAFWLGENSLATWNFNGGSAVLANVNICVNGSASGSTLNLNGGVFQASSIFSTTSSSAISTLNFNGATLQANANNPNFITGLFSAFVQSGGAVIDSQNYNIAIPQALQDGGGGGLTKNGTGTLTLTGANSYSGPTLVNAGVLKVGTSSSGNGTYNVADNAGFGPITQSANGQLNVSSLTVANSSGAALDFDLGSFGNPTVAPLNVSGTLTINGTITVNVADSVPQTGSIPLIQYGSLGGSGHFVLGTLPSGMVAHLDTSVPNTLSLVVTSAGAPRWDGTVTGGAWDIGITTNWYDLGAGVEVVYHDGNPVLFDDNATGTTTVNITTTVTPGSLEITNNNLPYTFVGTGKIAGNIGLNKDGTSSLAILNTGGNTFTGPVVINEGLLSITNITNGGLPSPLGASSANPSNLVINAATFSYAGAPESANRGFTLGATNSTIDTEGDLSLGGQVVAASNPSGSAFVKTGPAKLALTGTNDNEFAVINSSYAPGLDVYAGTLLLDGSAGGQTNHTQSDLWVGNSLTNGASLILSNTTLNVNSWLGEGRGNGTNGNVSSFTFYNSHATFGNVSLGYDAGMANYQATQILTLNGNSSLTNHGDQNLAESSGSTANIYLNDNSVLWCQNRCYLGLSPNANGSIVVANSAQMIVNNGWFSIAGNSSCVGSMVVRDSGSLSVSSDLNVCDVGNGASGSLIARDNATIVANNIFVGKAQNSVGTFTITNNATVVSHNGITLASSSGATGTVNLAGGSLAVNLVQGTPGSGIFNFNGGRLIARNPFAANFMFNLAAINVQSGGGTIDTDTNTISIAQPLLNAGGGLTKAGSGTLYLNGASTYTGTTVVSAGTLGGTGSLNSPVTVGANATLTAGAGSIGMFTINNALTLSSGSTTLLKITPASNDEIAGLTGVNYAGTLVVTNISTNALTPGSVFKLFNSSSAGSGNFASVKILPAGSGTFNPATGELTISSSGGSQIKVNPVTVSGGNLVLTGTGGTASGTYSVLTSTNAAAPVATWVTNTTGTFDGSGSFSNAIPVNHSEPGRFFLIKTP